MDIYHGEKKVADIEDMALWRPVSVEPQEAEFILVTLSEDDERWVEPGWYILGKWCDINRLDFEQEVVAWMPFPDPYLQ